MPEAPVPAAQMALDQAGIKVQQVDAIKTHNPFVANDLVFGLVYGLRSGGHGDVCVN
jgi:hypothetical protein